VGDFYLDTVASAYYGPKTVVGWGTARRMIGPTGPAAPKFVANVGAISAGGSVVVNHTLGTSAAIVQLFRNSSNQLVSDKTVVLTATSVTITSSVAESADALRVVVIG
jgi:hypothetical protein